MKSLFLLCVVLSSVTALSLRVGHSKQPTPGAGVGLVGKPTFPQAFYDNETQYVGNLFKSGAYHYFDYEAQKERLDYWYVLYHYYDSIIIDYGKQMSYKLTNKTRTCEAAPLNGTEMGKFTFVPPEAYWIGRSTQNGVDCDEYLLVDLSIGPITRYYTSVATPVVPVRWATWTLTYDSYLNYESFVGGPQNPVIFEVPEGFTGC